MSLFWCDSTSIIYISLHDNKAMLRVWHRQQREPDMLQNMPAIYHKYSSLIFGFLIVAIAVEYLRVYLRDRTCE